MKLSDVINNKDWKIIGIIEGNNIWKHPNGIKYIEGICQCCGEKCVYSIYRKNKNVIFCDNRCSNIARNGSKYYKPIERKCLTCNKNFFTVQSDIKTGRGKYCSQECSHKSKEKLDISKECLNCGKLFYGKPGIIKNKKFCNRTCFNEFKKKNAFREIKICPVCGKEFIVKQRYNVKKNGGKYCSPLCQNIARRKLKIEKICEMCGKIYFAWPCEADERKYCSWECKAKAKKTINWVEKNCLNCGKIFFINPNGPIKNKNKYCSNKCKVISEGTAKIKKKCGECGKIYYDYESKRKYCSRACWIKSIKKITFKRAQETGILYHPHYSEKACKYFKSLNNKLKICGQFATNGGEFSINFEDHCYYLDYYLSKINLAIEWDEKNHYRNGNLRKKDVKRQREIEGVIGKNLIRIREWIELDKIIAEEIIQQRLFELRG